MNNPKNTSQLARTLDKTVSNRKKPAKAASGNGGPGTSQSTPGASKTSDEKATANLRTTRKD